MLNFRDACYPSVKIGIIPPLQADPGRSWRFIPGYSGFSQLHGVACLIDIMIAPLFVIQSMFPVLQQVCHLSMCRYCDPALSFRPGKRDYTEGFGYSGLCPEARLRAVHNKKPRSDLRLSGVGVRYVDAVLPFLKGRQRIPATGAFCPFTQISRALGIARVNELWFYGKNHCALVCV